MTKIKSVGPKDFWQFFRETTSEKIAVFLTPEAGGLVAKTTENLDAPPDVKSEDKVSREMLIIFLKILVALKGGRPVKLIPAGKTQWRVFFGPKSS